MCVRAFFFYIIGNYFEIFCFAKKTERSLKYLLLRVKGLKRDLK